MSKQPYLGQLTWRLLCAYHMLDLVACCSQSWSRWQQLLIGILLGVLLATAASWHTAAVPARSWQARSLAQREHSENKVCALSRAPGLALSPNALDAATNNSSLTLDRLLVVARHREVCGVLCLHACAFLTEQLTCTWTLLCRTLLGWTSTCRTFLT